MMISFHLPPIAAKAAVSGQPTTGLARCRGEPLPGGSFWRELMFGFILVESWRLPMIVEVRRYRIKPGRREEFLRFFETRSVPALEAHGMRVLGPLVDLENPNAFVWLRA